MPSECPNRGDSGEWRSDHRHLKQNETRLSTLQHVQRESDLINTDHRPSDYSATTFAMTPLGPPTIIAA